MPITERTNTRNYPSCICEVANPLSCTNFPTLQQLAKELQGGGIVGKGATIVQGRVMTDASAAQVGVLCEAP